MGWEKKKAPYDKREKLTITKAIENKLNERKVKRNYLLDESTRIKDVDDDILSMGLGEESKVTNEWGVDKMEKIGQMGIEMSLDTKKVTEKLEVISKHVNNLVNDLADLDVTDCIEYSVAKPKEEMKTCENNQQCNCGLMHHASEEIKLILDDVHSVPKLYINGEHKEHIVSIEYIFETSQADASGTNAYKVVFFDEDEDGNAYERTIAVKRFPSNEFEWITK